MYSISRHFEFSYDFEAPLYTFFIAIIKLSIYVVKYLNNINVKATKIIKIYMRYKMYRWWRFVCA